MSGCAFSPRNTKQREARQTLEFPRFASIFPAVTRRDFITLTGRAALGCTLGLGGYSLIEAKWLRVHPVTLRLAILPAAWSGTTIAFLSDIHYGPYVPISYVRHAVTLANSLSPDIVALGGDFPHQGRERIAPCVAELGKLQARLGVFSVLGNHDHYFHGRELAKAALRDAGITELTNRGVWLERGRERARLRLCGVGDFWEDVQYLPAALGDATERDAVILLSHNPDYVESIRDPRVGLVLSGHTHGGQVNLPIIGPPIVPSLYGQKYAHGLVQGPVAQVFVSRGVGTITPPVRLACAPEIVFASLKRA